ncbi:hypothetical protein PG985_002051 [Apiospora marii]|uniref:uncharacterized protein n=1 Tax=Apiospora marii TaxID=335849 RepID=UPI00312DE512
MHSSENMYHSAFSYNLTRPYPFRWFTPVVVIGGIIITVLVSFFNFASNGYELVATSSNDPNATVNDPSQHGGIKWPSYFIGNSRATCAPATLPLKTLIYTQNNAISYTLTSVWRAKDDGTAAGLGSLVYHNNMLQNCNVTKVSIDITGMYTQSVKDLAVSHAGVLATALATCSVDIDTSQARPAQGPTYFELSGTYRLVNPEVKTFLSRNATTATSLYWGESMLNMYWMLTAKAYIDSAEPTRPDGTFSAAITLKRRSTADNGTEEEVMDDDFFYVECYTENSFCEPHNITSLSSLKDEKEPWHPYPRIWNRVNLLGKAMWFTVMTDLGRNESDVPNMLTHPNLLANLTANLTKEVEWWKVIQAANEPPQSIDPRVHTYPDPNLALKSFDPTQTTQPSLGATPAFLSTNYICQVPRTKAPGTLFFSILVADLVLLQAVWVAFRFVVDMVSQRKYPAMRYCARCTDGVELAEVGQLRSATSLV